MLLTMRIYFLIALLAVPAFLYFVNANNNYKDFMKEDDLKKNEFADFDAFDEDDDFESDVKMEDDKTESETPSAGPAFGAEDIVVEVICLHFLSPDHIIMFS